MVGQLFVQASLKELLRQLRQHAALADQLQPLGTDLGHQLVDHRLWHQPPAQATIVCIRHRTHYRR